MGNTALQAVCVRDDSIDMLTEDLKHVDGYISDVPDTDDSEKSFNEALSELRWDADLLDVNLHVEDCDENLKTITRKFRGPRKVLKAVMPRQPSTTPLDAYDEVCQQFNEVFETCVVSKKQDIKMEDAAREEVSCEEQDNLVDISMAGMEVTKSLADWPSHTWKIDLEVPIAEEDEDEMCSTACSSECAESVVDEEEEFTLPPSTFACTYRRSTSSAINLDDIPFELSRRSMFIVSDYLCPCGDCPWYEMIEKQVNKSVGMSTKTKRIVCRILQAYSTFNEVMGYRAGMIRIAQDCLFTSKGCENEAFEAFVNVVESQYANGWL